MDTKREEKLDQLIEDVKRLLFLIDNDDATGRKGLFKTVEELKERVAKLEDARKVQQGKNIVLGALGAFILVVLKEVLPYIF